MRWQFLMGYVSRRLRRRMLYFTLASSLFFGASQAFAQSYVGRMEVYGGSVYLNSPTVSLSEPGYHFQAGVRLRRWLSFGFDYSRATGSTSLTEPALVSSLQKQLDEAFSSGLLPTTYRLSVPIGTTTQNFAMGPQFPYRHFSKVTPFIRPSVGAVHEIAALRPADQTTMLIVHALTSSTKLGDWTKFYGIGGGAALNFSKHFSLVVQADYVHDTLFNSILRPRNTLRLSVGPGFQFGGNVAR